MSSSQNERGLRGRERVLENEQANTGGNGGRGESKLGNLE